MCVFVEGGWGWGVVSDGAGGGGGGGGIGGSLKNANKAHQRQCGRILSPAQTFILVLISYI